MKELYGGSEINMGSMGGTVVHIRTFYASPLTDKEYKGDLDWKLKILNYYRNRYSYCWGGYPDNMSRSYFDSILRQNQHHLRSLEEEVKNIDRPGEMVERFIDFTIVYKKPIPCCVLLAHKSVPQLIPGIITDMDKFKKKMSSYLDRDPRENQTFLYALNELHSTLRKNRRCKKST